MWAIVGRGLFAVAKDAAEAQAGLPPLGSGSALWGPENPVPMAAAFSPTTPLSAAERNFRATSPARLGGQVGLYGVSRRRWDILLMGH